MSDDRTATPIVYKNEDGTYRIEWPGDEPAKRMYPMTGELIRECVDRINESVALRKAVYDFLACDLTLDDAAAAKADAVWKALSESELHR